MIGQRVVSEVVEPITALSERDLALVQQPFGGEPLEDVEGHVGVWFASSRRRPTKAIRKGVGVERLIEGFARLSQHWTKPAPWFERAAAVVGAEALDNRLIFFKCTDDRANPYLASLFRKKDASSRPADGLYYSDCHKVLNDLVQMVARQSAERLRQRPDIDRLR